MTVNTGLKFAERAPQTFDTQEAATAYARNFNNGHGAAVVAEGGRFSVYRLEGTGWTERNFNLANVEAQKPHDSVEIKGADSNVKALVTGDGYVADLSGGHSKVELSGPGGDPFRSHVAAFGKGLAALQGDPAKFQKEFELAMRDTVFAALDHSEQAAKAVFDRLGGDKFTPEDKAAMERTQQRMAPIDAKLIDKRKEIDEAKRELTARQLSNSMQGEVTLGNIPEEDLKATQAAQEKVDRLQGEYNQLQAERIQAAKEFPLLLRVEPEKMGEFNGKSEADKVAFLRGEAKQVLDDIKTTRDNVKSGKFNLWTNDVLLHTTAAGLGITGDALKQLEERATHEKRVETAWKVGEAALTIGLAVGGAFFTGGTSLALLGASAALGLHSAVDTTSEYFRNNAAVNTDLDPSAGLLPPDMKEHWGWVAAAWIGVGLDAGYVAGTIRSLRAGAMSMEQAAKALNTDVKTLQSTIDAGKAAKLEVKTMPAAEFTARFGENSRAVTLLRQGQDGRLTAEVVANGGLSEAERKAALAEEFAHLQQLGDDTMKAKMLKLSEQNLSRWAEMQPEKKLDLIRTKLEVEADAQRRLIAHGGEGVDKTLAQQHLANIERKLADIKKIQDVRDPAQRAAQASEAVKGAEPPRLFAKGDNAFYGVPFNADHYLTARDGLIDAAQRVRQTLSGVQDAETAAARIENSVTDHLSLSDVQGAIRDILGHPVVHPRTGKVWDHLGEVQDALESLKNSIRVLQRLRQSRTALTETEKAALDNLISEASKHADRVEKSLDIARKQVP